jgi:signal transduction histidine kinase
LASHFDLQERIAQLARPLERFQVDELVPTLLALAVGLVWFAWRRWHQATGELARRLAAERELGDALAENRQLSQEYLLAQEDERRSLARELHDELGQCLNAMGPTPRRSATIRAHRRGDRDGAGDHRRVAGVRRRLDGAAVPRRARRAGLADAQPPGERMATATRRRLRPRARAGCGLGEQINMSLYRVVQECLTNVTRHARASAVEVRVEGSPGELSVRIRDDGAGMPAGTGRRAGLGLVGLRERVEALGGRFEVADGAPHGVEVRAHIPVAS